MGRDVFRNMYVGEPAHGSGPGSAPEATIEWRSFLENELSKLGHDASILDWGCGDWQHSSLIKWGRTQYVGIDVVLELIERVRDEHGRCPGRSFLLFDPTREGPGELLSRELSDERFDLAVCKDVIQHLPNDESINIIDALLDRCSILLLVNDITGPDGCNVDVEPGGCRHIDPRLPPFSLDAEELSLRFNTADKRAFFIKGRSRRCH